MRVPCVYLQAIHRLFPIETVNRPLRLLSSLFCIDTNRRRQPYWPPCRVPPWWHCCQQCCPTFTKVVGDLSSVCCLTCSDVVSVDTSAWEGKALRAISLWARGYVVATSRVKEMFQDKWEKYGALEVMMDFIAQRWSLFLQICLIALIVVCVHIFSFISFFMWSCFPIAESIRPGDHKGQSLRVMVSLFWYSVPSFPKDLRSLCPLRSILIPNRKNPVEFDQTMNKRKVLHDVDFLYI